jgi:ribonuclease R
VPVSTLGADYFRYDEASQSLSGEASGERFTLGQRLKLRLAEANPVAGSLRFELPETQPSPRRTIKRDGKPAEEKGRTQGKRGRPANIRHQGRSKR